MSQQSHISNGSRFFYTGVGITLIFFTVWGFHHFYLQGRAYPGRELAPPIRSLVIAHGLSMAAWVILMMVQPLLVAIGKRRIHMMLGKFGAGLAALIVVLGFRLGIESTRIAPPEAVIWGLTPKQFMAVPVFSIVAYGALIAAAIYFRRRPEIHRAFMVLGTMAAMAAAISRIDAISSLYMGTFLERLFGPFLATLVFAVLLIPARWILSKSIDRYYAWGCLGLTFYSLFIMQIAPTGLWDSIANLLL